MVWLSWPNRITIVRILLIVPLVMCLLNLNEAGETYRRAAMALFLVVALGDALDGYLARKLNAETPLGRFLDPLADKLLMTCTLVLLAVPASAVPDARLPNWVPVIAIGKDVLLFAGFWLVYATTGRYFIIPRPLGKACTLLQSVMVAFVLISPEFDGLLRPALPMLHYASATLAIGAAVDYLRVGNRFAKQVHMESQAHQERIADREKDTNA